MTGADKHNMARGAGVLRGHKYLVYEGGTRVPFIVRWPGKVKPGTTSDAMMNQIDFLASFAERPRTSPFERPLALQLADVVAGAEPALGRFNLEVQFINGAPGLPIPDLFQLLLFPEADQEILHADVVHRGVTLGDGRAGSRHGRLRLGQAQVGLDQPVELLGGDPVPPARGRGLARGIGRPFPQRRWPTVRA